MKVNYFKTDVISGPTLVNEKELMVAVFTRALNDLKKDEMHYFITAVGWIFTDEDDPEDIFSFNSIAEVMKLDCNALRKHISKTLIEPILAEKNISLDTVLLQYDITINYLLEIELQRRGQVRVY